MKKIITIITIILSININAQTVEEDNPYFPQPYRIIATNIISVSLDAIGDGLRDKAWEFHNPTYSRYGHVANAASTLALISIPLGQGFDGWEDWACYLVSYTLIRAAIFDPIYNTTRGNDLFYHGTSSYWDMVLGKGNWGSKEAFGRGVIFAVGIIIPIQEWHLRK